MWGIPTCTSSVLKKKKNQVKCPSPESCVPKTGSNSPIGSDLDSGRDKLVSEPRFRRFWISLRLRMHLHNKVLAECRYPCPVYRLE